MSSQLDLPRIPPGTRWKITETYAGIKVKLQHRTWYRIWITRYQSELLLLNDDDPAWRASEAAYEIINNHGARSRKRRAIARVVGVYQEES